VGQEEHAHGGIAHALGQAEEEGLELFVLEVHLGYDLLLVGVQLGHYELDVLL
jgi:hypothetical protein